MRELLERLCALNAVSSWEDEVRAFLLAEVEPHADRLRVDALGNLIAWKKGRKHTGSKLLLTAHMDEVGLMIRQITDDGYLKFDTVGAIDRRVLLGKPVLVGPKRVPGVVGLKAYHLVSREEEKSVPKLDEFYIDIGARDRAGAEAQVALGDTAAFDSDAGDFGAGLFHGKALGSRLGCAVLLTLLRDELPMDCTFVFTAQKEVGARGPSARPSPSPRRWRWWWTARMLRIWPECPPTSRDAAWAAVWCCPIWIRAPLQTGGSLRRCAPWRRPAASPGRPCARWPDAPIRPPSSGPKRGYGRRRCPSPCATPAPRPA